MKRIKLRTWIALGVLLFLAPVVIFSLFKPESGKAAWMNDAWLYRIKVPVTAHTAAETNVYFTKTVDTSDTTRFQSDCGDIRFTDANGLVLQYYIASGCSSASTVIHVLVPSFPAGASDYYMYYGNPTVINGFSSSDFTAGTSVTVGSVGSEEKTNGPTVYYRMDESADNTCSGGTNDICDARGTTIDGAISNGTAWRNQDFCLSGKCLFFDGSDDVVTTTQTAAINLSSQLSSGFTFEAWIKPNGAGEGTGGQIFFKGTNSWLRVDTLSGTTLDIEASVDLATTDATLNVAAAVKNNQWNHVALSYTDDSDDEITIWVNGKAVGTSTNGVGSLASDTNNLLIGGTTTNNFQGFIDEFKIYNYERTTAQMATDAIIDATSKGSAAVFGEVSNPSINNGLVEYLSMDEMAGNSCTGGANDNCDKSGNGYDVLWVNNTTTTGGKFGSGTTYDGTDDYTACTDANCGGLTKLDFDTSPSFSWGAWMKTSTSGTQIIAGKKQSTAAGQAGYMVYQNSTSNGSCKISDGTTDIDSGSTTLTNNGVWHHIFCVSNGKIMRTYIDGALQHEDDISTITGSLNNAEDFRTGTTGNGNNDFNGSIDEVRVYNRALSGDEVLQLYNWAPGPKMYLRLDQSVGGTAVDSSTYGNNGTITGGAFVPGKVGSSFLADDAGSDYVEIPDSDTFDGTANTSMTVSAWIKINGEVAFQNPQVVVSHGNADSAGSSGFAIEVRGTANCPNAGNDGTFVCLSLGDGTDTYYITTSTSLAADSTWHYLTVVLDRTSETNSRIYFDGVPQPDSRSGTFANIGALTSNDVLCLDVGSNVSCSGTSDHNTDDVKFYDYARTPTQIIEDMNAGHPAGGSPFGSEVIKWAFDEGRGTTANNQISGGTSGTLTSIASPATATSGWTVTGKTNKAIVFDGSDDKVVIATASDANVDFNGTEPFSICSFVYPTTMAGSGEADLIAGKWDATTPTRGYRLYLTNDDGDTTGNFRAEVYDESADQTISAAGSIDTVSVNTWYHVCMTFNGGTAGAASDLKLYVNATNVASNSVNASFLGLEDVTADFTVGDYDATDAVAADTAFTGTIDEVQVFAGMLTSDQIKIVMNAGASINFGATSTSEATQITGSAETPPVGYWNFDENTGLTAYDSSGNGNDGTLTSFVSNFWSTGKIGSALKFDNVDSRVDAGNASVLQNLPASGLSASAWIYPISSGESSSGRIVVKDDTGPSNGWQWLINSSNKIEFQADFSGGTNTDLQVVATNALTLSRWQHVAVTWDGSATATNVHIYLNGVEQTHGTDVNGDATRVSDATKNLIIGNSQTGTRTFDGYIDEVKVYNYIRTGAQVAYDYNRGRPIGWWKFDDCSGTTAYDNSGNGNNATLTYGGGTYTQVGTCNSGTASDAWYGGAIGKFNRAIALDTTTDTISVGNISMYSFERTNSFSTSIWFKTTTDGNLTLMSKQDSSSPFSGWNIQTATGGLLYFQLVNSYSSNTLEVRTADVGYSDGNWHQMVATYDGTSAPSGVHIYYDGKNKPLTTTVNTLSSSITNSISMYIGSRNGSAQKFDGLLDDARLYNYALTQSQVNILYNQGSSVRFGPLTGTPAP